jgi:hypothetical protein
VVRPMAPIFITSFEPQPHVEIRQGPTPYEITLTVTRETTTYTSTIVLGTEAATAAPTNVLATTTAATAQIQTLAPAPKSSSGSDNGGVIAGAVIGTIGGLAVLLVLIWKCCFQPQSALARSERYGDYGRSDRYGTSEEGSEGSSGIRVRRRGGSGDYGRSEYRGSGVRRPERVYRYSKRERRRSFDGDGSSEGWGDEKRRSSRRRRRRSGLVVRNGMAGWAFWGRERRHRSDRRRGSWDGSERVQMRFTTDD